MSEEPLKEYQTITTEERLCAICGKLKGDHHLFVPIKMPDGCICDPKDWGDVETIPDICAEYVGDGTDWCEVCEHDKKCHKK